MAEIRTDVVIIGAGTAGLSAAIYTQRAGKQAIVLEGESYGGQIINTLDVENYPGIKHISGFDFATGLYEQAQDLGAKIEMESALQIIDNGKEKIVKTKENDYIAGAVILATGVKRRELGIENEKELTGKGVSYCATCDGAFYRKKDVAVNGGGNTALEDAEFLTRFCNKVYLIHRRDQFRADVAEVKKITDKPNIELVLNSTIDELQTGEDGKLNGVETVDKVTGEKRVLPVSGLFVAIGQVPSNQAFGDVVALDDAGYIKAGEDTKTSAPGIFAAGDCRTKQVRQLATAASDGAVAALAACAYIEE
ncbi:thioredoxin reductase (NADPH) [Lachnospiraceae bacterium NK3A20]|nr:thioredoxin reductase (NADPH) [Lachnospiraceae bacterium NK3A20]